MFLGLRECLAEQGTAPCPGHQRVVVAFLLDGHELVGDRMEVYFRNLQMAGGYGGACQRAVRRPVGLEVGVAGERLQIAAQAEPGLVVESAYLRVVGGVVEQPSEVDPNGAAALAAGGRLDLLRPSTTKVSALNGPEVK